MDVINIYSLYDKYIYFLDNYLVIIFTILFHEYIIQVTNAKWNK